MGKNTKKRTLSLENTLLLMTIPFALFMILFAIVPLFGWSIAFVNYTPGVSVFHSEFVGFKYFMNLFTASSDFPEVIRNTLILSFLGLLCNPIPAILAIMLNEVKSSGVKRIIQTVTSLPHFTSWVIVFAVMFSFFSVDDGLINTVLLKLHVIQDPTNVLANSSIVWYFQTAIGLWKGLGWSAIIYLGAITGIDQELYEAATVDGAGRMKRILHITIPGLMPTFVVLTFLNVGSLLSGASFDQIFVFHNGVVHDKIQTLNYYVYSLGLQHFNFSMSTAVGMFNSVVSVILLTIAGLLSKRVIGRSLL